MDRDLPGTMLGDVVPRARLRLGACREDVLVAD